MRRRGGSRAFRSWCNPRDSSQAKPVQNDITINMLVILSVSEVSLCFPQHNFKHLRREQAPALQYVNCLIQTARDDVGEGGERCQRQIQRTGRRENNKQTRHRTKVPQYAPIVFQGTNVSSPTIRFNHLVQTVAGCRGRQPLQNYCQFNHSHYFNRTERFFTGKACSE